MTTSRIARAAALTAAAAATALALPAAAGAHGSVYETTARIVPSPAPSPITAGDLTTQKRYVFTNHGYTAVFRETNGLTSGGVINFAVLPSAYRNQASKTANFKEAWYLEGGTGIQAHATCPGVAALSSYENIGKWQGADPFYAYIPFQKNAAGFEDDPSAWIALVKTLTGVDLATVADPAAACAGLGGTYKPADDFNNPPTTANPLAPWTTLSSSTIAEQVEAATDPLNDKIAEQDTEISGLEGDVTGLKAKVAELEAAKAASDKALAEAQASAKALADKAAAAEAASSAASAQLKAASIPLGLAVSAESFSVAQLKAGVSVKLTGPAGEKAHARLLVSTATRRALGLPLRTLASATTTLGADGTTTVTLKSSAKALAKLTASTKVTVDVSAGGRTISTTATLTK